MASTQTGTKPPVSQNPNFKPKKSGFRNQLRTWNLTLKAFGMTTTGRYWLFGGTAIIFSYMLLSPMYNAMFWSVVYSTPGEWQRIKNWASNEPARSEALAEFREREARRQQAAANAATTQGAVAK